MCVDPNQMLESVLERDTRASQQLKAMSVIGLYWQTIDRSNQNSSSWEYSNDVSFRLDLCPKGGEGRGDFNIPALSVI